MTSRTSESWDAGVAHHPGTAQPRTVSHVGVMGLGQSHGGFFPLLTCDYACQKANSKDRHFIGDGEAASLCHLGGAQLVGVCQRGITALLLLLGLTGLIACCPQDTLGRALAEGDRVTRE